MIKSMTGFGRREATVQGLTISTEIRSVNHRFREIVMRLPKGKAELEEELKALIGQQCSRGRIEVFVLLGSGNGMPRSVKLDRSLARTYYQILRDLKRDLKLSGTIDVSLLGSFRELFVVEEQTIPSALFDQTIKRLVSAAVKDLVRMRRREGKILHADMAKRIRQIKTVLGQIHRRLPSVTKGYYDRMKDRVEKLLQEEILEDQRLRQELAIFADRCDVTEELTRLDSHCKQFDLMMKSHEPIGRQLDFLLQEMGREVNTIGSKANDGEIANYVVLLKGELEKIREQVQNVE